MAGKLLKRHKFVLASIIIAVMVASCFTPTRHDRDDRYNDDSYGYKNDIANDESDDYQTLRERSRNNRSRGDETTRSRRSRHGSTTVPLTRTEDGVFYLTVKINDVPMKFIYDTGASIISLSATEAMFLIKQGTITEDDLIGTGVTYDAQGDATESLFVRLKKVEIGDLVLENVEASIVDNQVAPLLLGQSALSQFNRVSIDYQNNLLIIE